MKELIGKTQKSQPHLPGKLLINKYDLSGKEEIANEFNTFFTNIGPGLAKKIQNVSRPFESYLKKLMQPCQQTLIQLTRSKRYFVTKNKQKSRV